MYVVKWLETNKLFVRVFNTYKQAQSYAISLMQSDIVAVSLHRKY